MRRNIEESDNVSNYLRNIFNILKLVDPTNLVPSYKLYSFKETSVSLPKIKTFHQILKYSHIFVYSTTIIAMFQVNSTNSWKITC